MPDTLTVNGAGYTVIHLLGKGKGGYSYLVTDGAARRVPKQIHHKPCEYDTFSNKLRSELRDYKTLRKVGIPMPRLLAVDVPQGGTLYYIDYECNAYREQWGFEHWNAQYWTAQTQEKIRYKN